MIKYIALIICWIAIPVQGMAIGSAEIQKNAHEIDTIVAAHFRKHKIAVPAYTDDSTFLRRAYLVAIGRIPTPQESNEFMESSNPQKRELLINRLYQMEGYTSHMTNWMYDLFTLREGYGSGSSSTSNAPLIDWVREAVKENKPWDEFCRELLTTKGNAYLTNGAAGYFAKGDAVDDHLSNTLRIFTGVRMECAQCHDDPFQEWEQMDFYQFKAFVDGPVSYSGKAEYRRIKDKLIELELNNAEEYVNTPVGKSQGLLYSMNSILRYGVNEEKGRGRVELPNNYAYRDADPGETVSARSAYGAKVRMSDRKDDYTSLDKFASWMIDEQTEQFAITIANRLWARVMGVSLTPVTGDYVAPSESNFPRLMTKIAEIMKAYDYDMNAFQQTLMSTRTFQFVSSHKNLENGSVRALDGRRVNRMSAEQVWDSLLSLASSNPDELPKRKPVSPYFIYADQYIMKKAELAERVNEMSQLEFEDFFLTTFEKLKNKEFPMAADEVPDYVDYDTDNFRRRIPRDLKRASEMPTPIPSGHFLSVFGQSRREAAIDEASTEGTVSQALELLNGAVQKHVVHNDEAAINELVDTVDGVAERIETIFLVVLSRLPDASEQEFCQELLASIEDQRAGYRNLIAGLVASQEFYFVF